ncbi:hypothetical protein [Deinococcus sp. YIM 77859]|uniref:hypothetical protein n=1 Tax=Deinococcus sp. YIM 77859 TaxID=1540221 RepID=UPI0005529842|nr:hypothetical protein [Deinococcus sp. YIM 77859]
MTRRKRLAALELAAEQAKAARVEAQRATVDRAWGRLSQADRETLCELRDAPQEQLDAVAEALKPYRVSAEYGHFLDWISAADEVAEDDLLPLAPVGAAEQLEAWAADFDRALSECEMPTAALMTAFRWGAANCRWWASLAREVGEVAG